MAQTSIPSYALYGEAQGGLSAGFAHIETIAARSSLHDWEIRPHRHADFVQLLLVHSGQAWITFDGAEQALAGPLAVMVPAGVVHGFRFAADVVGHVVTLGADFTGRAPAPADPLHRALAQGQAAPLPPEAARRAAWLAAEMLAAQADRSAGDPLLLSLAETLARCVAQDAPASGPAPDTRLDRFRQLVEIHYRSHRDLAFYAAALGTTPRTLSRLTAARLGCSPMDVVHRRLAREAHRLLRYTNATAAQVAGELGFEDPSYFSRFYLRLTGRRPAQDRAGGA
ncbi:helix-turn-helix domain-containing protein [Novosphingobium pokkalii]|uniref:Helix-turn-helix domain-containing protein n=1 Tax=Novosphingobium pokkalii TaxID=1770194 RepID=A0ABV7VAG0_9SPHN|nr:helix-turn-helix domain-containing protein [Novosphingobium pokkalii]GHC95172.1 AraC family transcriptional regulator [Novosphingobium pokkalii]